MPPLLRNMCNIQKVRPLIHLNLTGLDKAHARNLKELLSNLNSSCTVILILCHPSLSLTHSATHSPTHSATQPSKVYKTTAAKQKFQPTQSTHPSGLAVRPVVTLTFCDTLTCRVVCRNAVKSTFVLSLITLADQPHKYFFSFSFFWFCSGLGCHFLQIFLYF